MKINNPKLLALLSSAGLLGAITTANAAVGEMNHNHKFWEGVHAGVELGVAKPSVTNHWRSGAYMTNNVDQGNHRNRIDNVGTIAGVNIGLSFIEKGLFFGKDWIWGFEGAYMPTQVRNTTMYANARSLASSEHSIYELNSISTTRGRLGVIVDDIVFVGSAGISVIDSRFGSSTENDAGEGDSGEFVNYKRVNPMLGIGAQYKISDLFSFKIMIDHHFLYQTRNTNTLGNGPSSSLGQDSYVRQNGLTTAYVGMSYHFS